MRLIARLPASFQKQILWIQHQEKAVGRAVATKTKGRPAPLLPQFSFQIDPRASGMLGTALPLSPIPSWSPHTFLSGFGRRGLVRVGPI